MGATRQGDKRVMKPCVWIVGRCPKKLERNFMELSHSYRTPVARCRNIREMAELLYYAQYPSILICGSNVANVRSGMKRPVPILMAKDPMAERCLENHLKYVL